MWRERQYGSARGQIQKLPSVGKFHVRHRMPLMDQRAPRVDGTGNTGKMNKTDARRRQNCCR
jgi:hypothetical protein